MNQPTAKTNTILLIITLAVLVFAYISSSAQRKNYTEAILKSNTEVKKSNDSLITVIKDFIK